MVLVCTLIAAAGSMTGLAVFQPASTWVANSMLQPASSKPETLLRRPKGPFAGGKSLLKICQGPDAMPLILQASCRLKGVKPSTLRK